MLYGLETVSMRKRQESELEVAELKMLRSLPLITASPYVTIYDKETDKYDSGLSGPFHVGLDTPTLSSQLLTEPLDKVITCTSLFRRDPKAFPGQPKDIVSPACPGSSPGPLPGGACPEHLSRETSRRHPKQMLEPPQLPPFDVEEQRLYSELLPGDRAPYPISKGAPCHPTEEAHFGRLYPGSYPFGHDPELMAIGTWVETRHESLNNTEVCTVAPQAAAVLGHQGVGCQLEEKERFWSELDEVMESIPMGERVVIGADFNGHVGEGNRGDEEVMGKFGVKERNLEGQMVVAFAKRMDGCG
ncbi:hypothetical protein QTP86_011433 [Hemibagrus guttatus]|nr:hypothetical protein QTP86_011433 [Hemibagrus guttatus]